jgi:hypothetical protein
VPARRDQFEEVCTHYRDDDGRRAFIDNLLYATTVAQGQAIVLLTLRLQRACLDFCTRHALVARARMGIAFGGIGATAGDETRCWRAVA